MIRSPRSLLSAAALIAPLIFGAAASAQDRPQVDVELVLAVDISYSMDYDELALQREGYVQAVTSSEFLNALKQGTNGRVAVTLVEWAGANDQRVVLPWRLIDGPATADRLSDGSELGIVRHAGSRNGHQSGRG